MIDLDERPKLRWPLDVQTIDVPNGRCLILRDPLGLAERPAVIPAELGPVLARLDGTRTVGSIVQEGAASGLTLEIVTAIVRGLSQLLFLDSDETRRRFEEYKAAYRRQTLRPPALADRVYPADPEKLASYIDDFLRRSPAVSIPEHDAAEMVAVASPHIDYDRGWQTYAAAYQALKAAKRPDVIFLFGTAHFGASLPFHLSRKDFAVPSGVFSCARDAVDCVAGLYGDERLFAEELLHRNEHSLELQLPFLVHCYQGGPLPQIVPLLVGSFQQHFESGKEPCVDPQVQRFIAALAAAVRDLVSRGKHVLFHIAIDLAHVGLHFGDKQRMNDESLRDLEKRDQLLLDTVRSADQKALFCHLAEDNDKRRICGYPSLYLLYALLAELKWDVNGQTLDYRQAVDRQTDCTVSFAAAYWARKRQIAGKVSEC